MDIGLNQETATSFAGAAGLISFAKMLYNDWRAQLKEARIYARFGEHKKQMEDLAKKQAAQDTSLLAYMLEAEKTYARESAMQQSLAGVHSAMDNLRRELSGDMRTISNDIKVLIEKVAEKT